MSSVPRECVEIDRKEIRPALGRSETLLNKLNKKFEEFFAGGKTIQGLKSQEVQKTVDGLSKVNLELKDKKLPTEDKKKLTEERKTLQAELNAFKVAAKKDKSENAFKLQQALAEFQTTIKASLTDVESLVDSLNVKITEAEDGTPAEDYFKNRLDAAQSIQQDLESFRVVYED